MATVKGVPVSSIGTQDYEPFEHEGERFGDARQGRDRR
jgi:hypothetical protein